MEKFMTKEFAPGLALDTGEFISARDLNAQTAAQQVQTSANKGSRTGDSEITDKQQPKALRMADELEEPMTDFPQPTKLEAEAAAELRRLHAENETLRMGYAAARLEIESLRAAQPAGAQQPGDERASHGQAPAGLAVPSMSADEVNALPAAARAYIHQLATNTDPAGMVRENMQLRDTNAGLQSMYRKAADAAQEVIGCFHAAECEGLQAALAGTADEHLKDLVERRLMHALYAAQEVAGQAPAQAAPAYKDSTPELHVGDSAFESWYSTYNPAHKADKQRARDAYAAGMGDPLVTAAPAAVAGPVVNRATVIEWLDANDIEVTDRQMDGLFNSAAPTTQPAPQQEAQRPWGYAWRQSPFGWGFCSKQAYEQAAGRGEEVAKLYTAPQQEPDEIRSYAAARAWIASAAHAQADSVTAPAGGAVAGPTSDLHPEKCPITGRPFFMTLDHPELGRVPTYGGPYDSYTIPAPEGEPTDPWHERELRSERYDHDAGWWVEGGEPIPLRIVHEDMLFELQEDAEAAAAPTPPAQTADSVLEDAARLEQRSQPSESEGMTIAGNGASELGKLMREQRALRGGFYPDGNPNTARKQGANHD